MGQPPVTTELYQVEDGVKTCLHKRAYVDKACCPPGTIDCGCMGSDAVMCPNKSCTGVTADDAERLLSQVREIGQIMEQM